MPHNLKPCRFSFDDGHLFDGFAHGSTWNGFDNVAVTAETLAAIKAHFRATGDSDPDIDDTFSIVEPMDNGLYSLGWGFSTTIAT